MHLYGRLSLPCQMISFGIFGLLFFSSSKTSTDLIFSGEYTREVENTSVDKMKFSRNDYMSITIYLYLYRLLNTIIYFWKGHLLHRGCSPCQTALVGRNLWRVSTSTHSVHSVFVFVCWCICVFVFLYLR